MAPKTLMKPNRKRQQKTQALHGALLSPSEIFERPLSGCFVLDADRPFEERVERAWRHIRATRFTPEEHERLRAVLVEMLKVERWEPGSTR
jgi:hypothetical protein